MITRKMWCILLFACCGMLLAAPKVDEIIIESAGGSLHQESLEQVVFSTIRTKVGEEFSAAVLSDDIAQLYKSGLFNDVQTKLNEADGKYQVIFIVKTRKTVSKHRIEGNELLKTSLLERQIKLANGSIADEQQLAKDRLAIMTKYRDKGYYGTQVRSVVTDDENGETVTVTYIVTEKPRAKLKGTEFVGNTVFDAETLEKTVLTQRPWWRYIIRFGGYFNDQQLPTDLSRLQELYTSVGYLDFAVEEVEMKYEDGKTWVTPVYHLYEGKPYSIGKITISGFQRFTAEELLGKTHVAVGDVYSSSKETADVNAMKAMYDEFGYLNLQIIPKHTKHSESQMVDVEYQVYEGSPANIRDIIITGNRVTQDRIIRRELTFFPGDLGNNSKIQVSKARLMNMGLFSSADIYPVVTPIDSEKDIRVEVVEKETGSLGLGAGFSTEDSITGFIEFQERNFDLARLFDWPARGAAQSFRTMVSLGDKTQNINVSLIEPSIFDSGFELATDFFLTTRYEDEYDEHHIGGDMTLSWPVQFVLPFTEHMEYWNVGVGVRVDRVRISNISHEERSLSPDSDKYMGSKRYDYRVEDDKGNYWDNGFNFKLIRDTRDNYHFPTRGSRVNLDSELITQALGSYANIAKFHAGGAKYYNIISDVVFKTSLDFHDATKLNGRDVRIFDRYFAGGVGTIRGFKRHDVSPYNSNDNTIGGEKMLCGTFEVMKPVKDFVYVGAFLDYGNVWWNNMNSDINSSIGLGMQFKAFPIRLDYGYPIHTEGEHLEGKHGRFHFNVMYSF